MVEKVQTTDQALSPVFLVFAGVCVVASAAGAFLAPHMDMPAWLGGMATGILGVGLCAVGLNTRKDSGKIAAEMPLSGAATPDAPLDLDRAAVQKREAFLPDSVQFARAAIEATPNPVLVIDGQLRLVAANAAARQRFGFERMMANAGGSPVRFDSVMRRPDLIEAVEHVLSTGLPRTLAFETHVPIDRYERASIMAFDHSSVRHVLVSVQDETEARMSERMRADFLANASHELRTPLASIVGFIETLRGPARDDPSARDRFLEIMHFQADRMSRLISDLLSLSRIELNEHVLPTGRADLSGAVQEAVDGLPPALRQRVVIVGDQDALWMNGDWDEVQQIVLNLVDNALKYSSPNAKVHVRLTGWLSRDQAVRTAARYWEGAARLPLTSPSLEHDQKYCVLRVEDEGPGIERQHLPRLAERFYRVEETATGRTGTGLGLAIVKHIVSRHRGGLMVESERGRGSAFAVYLPQPADLDPEIASLPGKASSPKRPEVTAPPPVGVTYLS
jgi:two-component system, OmpR family, phosphate regulon sensor histidine kinase PhoR